MFPTLWGVDGLGRENHKGKDIGARAAQNEECRRPVKLRTKQEPQNFGKNQITRMLIMVLRL
jgi:hypothetical protein